MICPHWEAPAAPTRQGPPSLGSRRFRCRSGGRRFNERSGTPVNDRHYPTDVVLLAVLRRLRDTRSCRDIAAMLLERGCSVTPETIRAWACRFAPRVTARRRAKRRGRAVTRLVPGRDRRAGGRALVRSRPRPRPRGRPPGRQAQRAPRHARRAALPAAPRGRGRAHAAAHHDGPASSVPDGDPLDPGTEGRAPDASIPQPPHGTGPPRGEAALVPDARFRELRLSGPLLLGV